MRAQRHRMEVRIGSKQRELPLLSEHGHDLIRLPAFLWRCGRALEPHQPALTCFCRAVLVVLAAIRPSGRLSETP